ncbi:MAG: TonB-dependent receptor, partial [Gammaproteobacteria bacterium]|nr:TonB-dependent receptor [Gammaproteobacteria bacterium]
MSYAQTSPSASGATLEEVVVTARKRSESLQQTPITVTAVTAEEISARNLSSITDLGQATPNVSLTAGSTDVGGAANAVFFIRGIGQLDYAPTADPGIGVYVDGVYLGRAQGAVMELADVRQVEILKGPQGTLFGKNTMGGALNITTKDPDDKFGGRVGITGGEDSRFNADLELTGPITETVAARISAAYRSKNGFQRRPYASDSDRSGAEGTTVLHGKLAWTPGERTRIVLAGDYTDIDAAANLTWIRDNVNTWPPTSGNLVTFWNTLVGTAPGNMPFTSALTSPDPRVDNGTYSNRLRFQGGGASLRVEWQTDPFLLRSISAYRTFDSRNRRDMDGSPVNFGYVDYRDHQWQASQEIDLIGKAFDNKLDWTAGAFYFHENAASRWLVGLAPGIYQALNALPAPLLPLGPYACPNANPLTPCAGGPGNPVNLVFDTTSIYRPAVETDSYAVFTEMEWHFTGRLSAIAGARYSHDRRDYTFSSLGLGSGLILVGPADTSKSWS